MAVTTLCEMKGEGRWGDKRGCYLLRCKGLETKHLAVEAGKCRHKFGIGLG